MSARSTIADLLWWSVPSSTTEDAKAKTEQLLDKHRIEVIAERDAQIITWLTKKAGEEGTSNKDSRTRATAIYRMADKLSRGAVRPPLSAGPDAIEYAVAFTEDDQDGVQVHSPTESRTEAEARVSRYLDMYPTAHLVQRTVHRSKWTDPATP
ncbi:hypothetical protein OG571_47550 (plasmid) [Streptomyces sp. NBC_01369]|uniref:hypothetical protein n=1 Tax=Streptomyces sp. NBC_01369 TaxID=2903842 RepID=UPI002F911DE6